MNYNPKPGSPDGPPTDFLPFTTEPLRPKSKIDGVQIAVGCAIIAIPLALLATLMVWAIAWLVVNFPGGS